METAFSGRQRGLQLLFQHQSFYIHSETTPEVQHDQGFKKKKKRGGMMHCISACRVPPKKAVKRRVGTEQRACEQCTSHYCIIDCLRLSRLRLLFLPRNSAGVIRDSLVVSNGCCRDWKLSKEAVHKLFS